MRSEDGRGEKDGAGLLPSALALLSEGFRLREWPCAEPDQIEAREAGGQAHCGPRQSRAPGTLVFACRRHGRGLGKSLDPAPRGPVFLGMATWGGGSGEPASRSRQRPRSAVHRPAQPLCLQLVAAELLLRVCIETHLRCGLWFPCGRLATPLRREACAAWGSGLVDQASRDTSLPGPHGPLCVAILRAVWQLAFGGPGVKEACAQTGAAMSLRRPRPPPAGRPEGVRPRVVSP